MGKWIKRVLAVLLLCAMVLCYARWIEPRWIQVKKVELSLPGLTEKMRVVCFGDTHMGLEFGPEDLEKWVEKINRQEPQAVVFLGDLFDNYSQYEGDPEEVSRVLSQLQAPCKLAVMGNHDVINRITKELYPGIARHFGTSASKVERAIRHAIEVAWNRGRIETLNTAFGCKVCTPEDKPTNGEFIAMIAERNATKFRSAAERKNAAGKNGKEAGAIPEKNRQGRQRASLI